MNSPLKKMRCAQITVAILSVMGIVFLVSPAFGPIFPNTAGITAGRATEFLSALQQFQNVYGEYPKGEMPEIMKVLMAQDSASQNKKGIVFYTPAPPRKFLFWNCYSPELSPSFEFLDAWGNPFKLDLNRETGEMKISSFGKNRRDDQGKADDIAIQRKY